MQTQELDNTEKLAQKSAQFADAARGFFSCNAPATARFAIDFLEEHLVKLIPVSYHAITYIIQCSSSEDVVRPYR